MDDLLPASGRFEGKAHLLPVRVYYEDTDFTGVVYHANYLRYFERGRSEFLRLTGISHTQLRALEQPMAFVVVRMTIDYRKAARIDDALIVRTEYQRIQKARLHVRQTLTRGLDVIAEAVEEIACIDLDGRPRRPPSALVDGLREWFRNPPP
ncbi:MAG: tol-pal system-associated acyl-CoA thioesterase [Caulobacteraceae bacterium]